MWNRAFAYLKETNLSELKPGRYQIDGNEINLARALDEGLIAGAGVDVLEKEPISTENPLLHIKHKERLAITPHSILASIESRTVLIEKVAQNIKNLSRKRNFW